MVNFHLESHTHLWGCIKLHSSYFFYRILFPFSSDLPNGFVLSSSQSGSGGEKDRVTAKAGGFGGGGVGAICYSGFRSGQYSDRGEGPKNPSDAEMLDDLKILSKDGFRLIRIYDSRENSAAVLELIKTHKIPIRGLLGAWLSAEVNNPKYP